MCFQILLVFIGVVPAIVAIHEFCMSHRNNLELQIHMDRLVTLYFPEELRWEIGGVGAVRWFGSSDSVYLDKCVVGYGIKVNYMNTGQEAFIIEDYDILLKVGAGKSVPVDFVRIPGLDPPFILVGQSIEKSDYMVYMDHNQLFRIILDKGLILRDVPKDLYAGQQYSEGDINHYVNRRIAKAAGGEITRFIDDSVCRYKTALDDVLMSCGALGDLYADRQHVEDGIRDYVDMRVATTVDGVITGFIGECVYECDGKALRNWVEHDAYYHNRVISTCFNDALEDLNKYRCSADVKLILELKSAEGRVHPVNITPAFLML